MSDVARSAEGTGSAKGGLPFRVVVVVVLVVALLLVVYAIVQLTADPPTGAPMSSQSMR